MGWLWMCLGVTRDKSARRIGGRVSSDTYLAPQYDPTKTPRIEDYLQPRGVGCCAKSSDVSSNLAGGQKEAHLYRRCVSESIKGAYGRAEDHTAVEDFVSIEFPRVPRKSFSELLIETDTLDKGPLALAAMAAAAERTARSSRLQQEAPSKEAEGSQIVTLNAVKNEPVLKKDQLDSQPLSSLSKDHLEASNAVAAFRESRRQISSSSTRPSYISSLFRSSRKRSLPTRSRSFQRPLSPVPEVVSLEEELRSRRKSDVVTSTIKSPSSSPTTASKPNQDLEDWDDYVMVDRAQETIPDAASSSIDAHISSPSSEATAQDDATSSSPQQDATSSSPQRDYATSSLPQQDHTTSSSPPQDASSSLLQRDAPSSLPHQRDASSLLPEWDASSFSHSDDASSSGVKFERQHEDESLLRTPARDPLVTPEVFISPKTTSAELNFTRVMDMDPEERPIFGSLADHWEAAWATKRPAWDGKGIPNSTNKYREDQKVMWHAAPFEERLAQALASQQDPLPQRRNSFNGRTSRLAASRNDTSLQAH